MQYQLIKPVNPNYSVFEQILTNRGINYHEVDHYLFTDDHKDIYPPEIIKNIDKGASTLQSHIENNHDIFIQIDSDADGYTSAAILINYLRRVYPNFCKEHLTYRLHEGKEHGIILDTIPTNCKLVIAPDASSNQYDEHKELQSKGIDMLVIDHHEADMESPYAIVINNQISDYPTKSLSGAGMVYKFCCYLDTILDVDYANDYLDLTALGLIADMVSMRDFETKHLTQRGIKKIRNPYLKGMKEKNSFSLGNDLTPIGIAFYIAPYINATVRIGTAEEKKTLFQAMLDLDAYQLVPSTKRGCKGQTESRVEQAIRNSINIKNRQTKARDAGLEKIESIIGEGNLLDNKILVVQLEEGDIDKNLTGLVANQLMSKYKRPVLLLHKVVEDGIVRWQGSGRGYDKSKLDDLKGFLNESGFVQFAEGHANAFGTAIENTDFDDFIEYANNELADLDFSASYKVDFIYDSYNFSTDYILDIAGLKRLWGKDIEESLVALENVIVTKNNITLMSPNKNPTLKIALKNGLSLIKFKSSQEEYETLATDGYVKINIVGTCEENEWMGNISAQLIIKEYEIIETMPYFF